MTVIDRAATLDACYPAQPSQIAAIRHTVAALAREHGAGEEALLRVNLAVSEAVTNAIAHGYGGGAHPGDLRVTVRAGGDGEFVVHVGDRGIGLSARRGRAGLGLGLSLMAHEAEHFEIRRVPEGGTEVILHFQL